MIQNKKSFARSIMKNMIIRLTLVILTVSVVSTYYLQHGINKQLKAQMSIYSETKTRNEKLFYDQASDNMQLIVNAIIKEFTSGKKRNFQTDVLPFADGSFRSDIKKYEHQKEAGVYLPKSAQRTPAYLNEMAVVENVFNKFAPTFFKNFFQLWYVSSKKGFVSFVPSTNKYVYESPADFNDTTEHYFRVSEEDLNPDRKKVWTRVYEDINYKRWMISLVTPIYKDDVHIGTVGVDFLLEDLIGRIQNDRDIGLSNYIIDQAGYLIGHYKHTHKIIKSKGALSVRDIEDPILKEIYEKISLISSLKESVILDLKSTTNHIGVSKLESPPWFIITEQDPEYYSNTILSLLQMVIAIAIFSLIVEIFIVYRYLQKEAVLPIQKLSDEITQITLNNFSETLVTNQENEIGIIQKSFNQLINIIKEKEKEITNYQNLLEEKVSSRSMELNRALRMAEEAKTKAVYTEKMASLGEMASGIAHEINNPLTIIQLNLTALEKMIAKGQLDEEKAYRAVQKIDSIADRILEIIKGLNQFSESNYDQNFKSESLQKLIKQAIELMSNKLQSFDVQISYDVKEDFQIMCLETQILQVFTNLISNSIDAIENRNKEDRWIKIWCDKNQNFLFVFIQDSGDGIPEAVIQKMMTPFFTTKEIGKGTGLGLSIIRGIVEKHRGNIQYDNTRSKTTFVIKFPIIL